MDVKTTKSVQALEQRMEGLDKNSLRYQILENAKNFKTSWIELGRSLYSVFKDKLYKEWGYGSFDTYVSREIGIRKQTAMKLLRSYYFLEKEEPQYLKSDYLQSSDTATIPNYESVDLLRRVKNKPTLDDEDYAVFKKEVFEKGRDALQIKKDLTALIRQREELEPEEARKKKRAIAVHRLLSTLKSLKKEIEISKLLPAGLIKETSMLINKLEEEIE